jgi:hypothetical protein
MYNNGLSSKAGPDNLLPIRNTFYLHKQSKCWLGAKSLIKIFQLYQPIKLEGFFML